RSSFMEALEGELTQNGRYLEDHRKAHLLLLTTKLTQTRGIFLLRKKEIDWFYEGGTVAIFHDAHCYLDGNADAMEFCSQDWYHHILAVFTCNLQQDRYQKVEKSMAEMSMDENEISITSQGRLWGDQIIYRRTHKLDPLISLASSDFDYRESSPNDRIQGRGGLGRGRTR
ncbi:hypothetical protein S245_051234, partial [Arachis hypogaea]